LSPPHAGAALRDHAAVRAPVQPLARRRGCTAVALLVSREQGLGSLRHALRGSRLLRDRTAARGAARHRSSVSGMAAESAANPGGSTLVRRSTPRAPIVIQKRSPAVIAACA